VNCISPSPRRTILGPCSRYFAGSHFSQTWAGSTTWSSTETISGMLGVSLMGGLRR